MASVRRIHEFTGGDGGLYGKHSDGTTWGAWMAFGGYLASDAVPVADGIGLVHVFVVGGDGAL